MTYYFWIVCNISNVVLVRSKLSFSSGGSDVAKSTIHFKPTRKYTD